MAFSTITPKQMGRGAISASPTVDTIYTVDALTRAIVKSIDISNTTAGLLTVNVYLVPSAGTAGTSNALLYGVNVPANGNIQWFGTQVLNAGDTIQCTGSAAGLTINVSGGEAV